ncbi:calpastatin [Tersicoccus solisilvae]|uniref:Calpastatin n=1 Tax=Tersicoccus solisilvae TaxID=1882339 RepID=A0ABQ1NM23_9MICC|nr:DUF1810 domain-containing protein [Tersicoccus solisilvae]GGC80451.1 calpastatin [Tersicoccus solisilvae]
MTEIPSSLPADDPFDLDRFVRAQAGGTWETALAELERGRKTSHWMWFVFPQIEGLGRSPMAQRYAISSLEEARAYLSHPVLGPRLLRAAESVATAEGSAEEILGGIDAVKLRSSMTLFARADPGRDVFARVLQRCFDGEPDAATLARI